MKRTLAMLVLPAYLMACVNGTNPFEGEPVDAGDGAGDGTTEFTIPGTLAGDVTRIVYDPATQTLTVEGQTLDEVPFSAMYRRRPGMDVPGYEAYTVQDDPLDRHHTAYAAQSRNEGAVRAGIVASGGVRNRVFAGGYYERDGAYDPPDVTETTGLVSYAGQYVGVTNTNGDGGDLMPVPPGTPGELVPGQAAEITGDILLQADFADNVVEGNIYNRVLVDSGTALPSIVLISTGINTDGTFEGSQIEYEGEIGTDIGDYAGIFGGTDASGVAGILHLTEWDGPGDPLGFDEELEWGVFVLDQCGQAVDDPICDGVNPDAGIP